MCTRTVVVVVVGVLACLSSFDAHLTRFMISVLDTLHSRPHSPQGQWGDQYLSLVWQQRRWARERGLLSAAVGLLCASGHLDTSWIRTRLTILNTFFA